MTEPRDARRAGPSASPAWPPSWSVCRWDVIVARAGALPALKQATSTIPIVMAATSDPVRPGVVQSLGSPGGNFTGLSLQSEETTGKRLELLMELVPCATPVAVLWERPGHPVLAGGRSRRPPGGSWCRSRFDTGARSRRPSARRPTLGPALSSCSRAPPLFPHARRMAGAGRQESPPGHVRVRPYVEAGGLISYGADINEIWWRRGDLRRQDLEGRQARRPARRAALEV